MGIRNLRTMGDECLRKNCKEIKMITPRIRLLAGDM